MFLKINCGVGDWGSDRYNPITRGLETCKTKGFTVFVVRRPFGEQESLMDSGSLELGAVSNQLSDCE